MLFNGTFQDNNPADPAVPLTWTLSPGQLNGTYQYNGQPPYPWCGVAAGQGTPLPLGCGWSENFKSAYNPTTGGGPVTLQQTADEVTGVWYVDTNGAPGRVEGNLYGVVSDFRVNGQYINTIGGSPGRFSFWMTLDGTQFSGNYYFRSGFEEWCGARPGVSAPATCLGGGGMYDGTWFTNFGTVTLKQPQPFTAVVSGIWFWWGGETEYPITGTVVGPDAGSSTAFSLSWSDSSPLGGAVGMTSLPSDPNSLTLQGRTAVDAGAWCGVNYGANPFVPLLPDAGQIGTLYEGCGLTSSWNFSGTPTQIEEISGDLVQTRGSVFGSISPTGFVDMYVGSLAFNASQDAGVGAWLVVAGNWSLPDGGSGTFTWYPDSDEQSFTGDYTEVGEDAGAWCGSHGVALPNPCGP
jgi:hypothetical protein